MPQRLTGLIARAMRDGDEQKRRAVWAKGLRVPGFDPAEWCFDEQMTLIRYSEYGQQTAYGWEIDHRTPSALGGLDEYPNLRPLHWKANRSAGGTLGALFNSGLK